MCLYVGVDRIAEATTVNKEEFGKAVQELTRGAKVDFRKMPKWFEGTLRILEELGKQKEGVHHPGHRGTAREHPLQDVLAEMLPDSFTVTKGFAINHLMTESKEQDLLVIDRNIGGRLLPGEGYFPIEPCLASVQVKSTLTRTQIRDATVNCISIKRLFGWPLVSEEQSDREYDKLCYVVFSYGSRSELDRLADVLNDELAQVNRHLWPNMFYVLGKGLLIPGDERGVPFDKSTMFTGPRFRSVQNVGAEPALPTSEAYSFLWFLSNIIDHCMEQRGQRESLNLNRYWFYALSFQTRLNQTLRGK